MEIGLPPHEKFKNIGSYHIIPMKIVINQDNNTEFVDKPRIQDLLKKLELATNIPLHSVIFFL